MKKRDVIKITDEKASENLNKLFLNGILTQICNITFESKQDIVIKTIENYKVSKSYQNNTPSDCTSQAGRLWILVEEDGDIVSSLNVGQSLDIVSEIMADVNDMYNKEVQKNGQYNFYYSLRTKHKGNLVFYEVAIDKCLLLMFEERCELSGITKVIYDIAKEYMAEAAVAYNTGAKYWQYYNSGLDKRSYFYLRNF